MSHYNIDLYANSNCICDNSGEVVFENHYSDTLSEVANGTLNNSLDKSLTVSSLSESNLGNSVISVMSWNIQGIGTKFELDEIRKLLYKNDIVFLFETMKLDSYEPQIDGFCYFHCQRSFMHPKARRPSGGIAVMIRDSLYKSKVKVAKTSEHAIWLQIKNMNQEIYIGGVYIPPQGSSINYNINYNLDVYANLREDLAMFLDRTPYVSICGDLNSRIGQLHDFEIDIGGKDSELIRDLSNATYNFSGENPDWSQRNRQSKDKTVNSYGRDLLELCKASNIRVMNGFFNGNDTDKFTCFTPIGQSVVDYLLCSESMFNILKNFEILSKLAESDHTPLYFSFNIAQNETHALRNIENEYNCTDHPDKFIFDADKLPEYIANFDAENSQYKLYKLSCDIARSVSVDAVIDTMYEYVTESIKPTFKKRKSRALKNTFPTNKWFDEDCKILRKDINNFAKHNDLSIACNKAEYLNLNKQYKQLIQRKKRQFQDSNRQNMEKLLNKNQSECWKEFNKLKRSNYTQSGPDLNTFHLYFEQQSHPPSRDFFDVEHIDYITNSIQSSNYVCNNHISQQICDSKITMAEVSMHLRKLKNNKASGIDGIPAEFYKYASEKLISPFCSVFNYVFESGEYPTQWSEGLIKALHKKGDKANPDNYRKITINVVMGKIFDSILNSRLYFKNEALQIDDPCQFGFTPDVSTTDCVFVLDTVVKAQKSKHKPIYLCFVDFTKAFDYINRNALYYKLTKQNIGDRLLKIIMSMYDKAKARVCHAGKMGAAFDSKCGVLQGGILSPKLFNEYLSDLQNYMNHAYGIQINDVHLTHIAYADDIVLLANSAEQLQLSINCLHDFCRKWHLIVNVNKTKVMTIGEQNNSSILYNGETIEEVSNFKYLGHMLTNNYNMHSKMTEYLTTQAQKAIFALQGDTKHSLGYISPQLSMKMFDTYILPILEYNSEIWTKIKPINEIEKVQLGYLKHMLGIRKQAPTLSVYGETGRFPLHARQQMRIINYWLKLEKKSDDSILKKCLNFQKDISAQNSWFGRIRAILQHNKTSLDEAVIDGSINNSFSKIFKQRLYQKYQDDIITEINDSGKQPKLRTYKLIKTDLRIEPYLLLNANRKIYTKIARFRTSSHNLRIETGRHEKPKLPVENRICNKCNLNVIEDEIHCILICPNQSMCRVDLLKVAKTLINNFEQLNDSEKFIAIMTSREPELLKNLGKFLVNADV